MGCRGGFLAVYQGSEGGATWGPEGWADSREARADSRRHPTTRPTNGAFRCTLLQSYTDHELAELDAHPEKYIKLLPDAKTISIILKHLRSTTLSEDWLQLGDGDHLSTFGERRLNCYPWEATTGASFSAAVSRHIFKHTDESGNLSSALVSTVTSPQGSKMLPPASPSAATSTTKARHPLLALRHRIHLPDTATEETAVFRLLRLVRQFHAAIAAAQHQELCLAGPNAFESLDFTETEPPELLRQAFRGRIQGSESSLGHLCRARGTDREAISGTSDPRLWESRNGLQLGESDDCGTGCRSSNAVRICEW
ncbi:hypothetical protein V8E36_002961 [Tilletia maclaganii]